MCMLSDNLQTYLKGSVLRVTICITYLLFIHVPLIFISPSFLSLTSLGVEFPGEEYSAIKKNWINDTRSNVDGSENGCAGEPRSEERTLRGSVYDTVPWRRAGQGLGKSCLQSGVKEPFWMCSTPWLRWWLYGYIHFSKATELYVQLKCVCTYYM